MGKDPLGNMTYAVHSLTAYKWSVFCLYVGLASSFIWGVAQLII